MGLRLEPDSRSEPGLASDSEPDSASDLEPDSVRGFHSESEPLPGFHSASGSAEP